MHYKKRVLLQSVVLIETLHYRRQTLYSLFMTHDLHNVWEGTQAWSNHHPLSVQGSNLSLHPRFQKHRQTTSAHLQLQCEYRLEHSAAKPSPCDQTSLLDACLLLLTTDRYFVRFRRASRKSHDAGQSLNRSCRFFHLLICDIQFPYHKQTAFFFQVSPTRPSVSQPIRALSVFYCRPCFSAATTAASHALTALLTRDFKEATASSKIKACFDTSNS